MDGRFAIVGPVGDILEKQVDLLAGDDVADVVGLGELAEDQADHLAVDQGRAAAVARVDRRVDLDAHAREPFAVAGEFDPRHDPLGDRERRAPLGIAVNQHRFLDFGQSRGAHDRRPLFKERLILEPDHGQVDSRADRLDLGGQLVARLVAFDEELAGVEHDVGIGQDALAVDDDPGAAGVLRAMLGPGMSQVRDSASSR